MKSIDYDVPFYPNTDSGTHCFQATLKMILKYFMPSREFSWEELDQITSKQKDMWTWSMAGLSWLVDNGFEVLNIEEFDYQAFLANPERYLIEKYGERTAAEQLKHSDVTSELVNTQNFIKKVKTENRLPDVDEIYDLLRQGYLLIANVNSRSLNLQPGYTGHFVLIKGQTDSGLNLHDPGGAPGEKNRKIAIDQFLKGWDYPDETSRNLIAVRLHSQGDTISP